MLEIYVGNIMLFVVIWTLILYFSISVGVSLIKLLGTWLRCKKEELGWD